MDYTKLLDTLESLHNRLTPLEGGISLKGRKTNRNRHYQLEHGDAHFINNHATRNDVYYIINNFIVDSANIRENTDDVFQAIQTLVDSIADTDANWRNKLGKMLLRNYDHINIRQLWTWIVHSLHHYTLQMKNAIIAVIQNIINGDTAAYA